MDGGRSTQDWPGMLPGPHVPGTGANAAHDAAGERRDVPAEGGRELTTEALGPSIIRDVRGDSGQSPRACGGRTKSGARCGIIMTVATPDGPRCRFHRDPGPGRVRAPVRRLGSMEDAAKLMSWCAVAVAEGRISQSQALALKASVSEWRQSFESGKRAAAAEKYVRLMEAAMGDAKVMAAILGSSDPAVRVALDAVRGSR